MKKKKVTTQSAEFLAVFEEELDGGYSVWVPDLPGCASQGNTIEQALENIKEAIELYVEEEPADELWENVSRRQFIMPIATSIQIHA